MQLITLKHKKLPWWTWVVPILVFHAGSEISLLFKYTQGIGAIYLPTAFGLILINWWGWERTLPALYLNGLLTAHLWGITTWHYWPIYPIPETFAVFLSYYIFSKLLKGKYWMPDIQNTIRFVFIGIFIPFAVDLFLLQLILVSTGEQPINLFWTQFLRNYLGEVTTHFGICLVVLFYFSGFMQDKMLLLEPTTEIYRDTNKLVAKGRIELTVIFIALFLISWVSPFEQYWFIYGFASLFVAIRYGFGETLICNLLLFLITYVLPAFIGNMKEQIIQENYLFNIFLGNLMLYVFAALTGRIISDLRIVENKLNVQNQELDQANKELDRFVYSVSHDLSAPLKSIKGLVMISQLDNLPSNKEYYLVKIKQSVSSLEFFIKEILDYSRNKRVTITKEKFNLNELCIEIIENLKYMENYQSIEFNLDGIADAFITTDRLRLKIILTNLFSNAIKFQKQSNVGISTAKVYFKKSAIKQQIYVEDNGDGIDPQYQAKIFDMFFRARSDSNGSGLGLYIAKEAADKINGKLLVTSELGKGTTFIIELPSDS